MKFITFNNIYKLSILLTLYFQCLCYDITDSEMPEFFDPKEDYGFDSYNHLTKLEDYPEVCTEYSDEKCARMWLDEMNQVLIRNGNRMGNVNYKYLTNINEENSELKQKFQFENSQLSKGFQDNIKKFNWRSFKDPELRRIFDRLSFSLKSKNESLRQELIKIESKISLIYNTGKPCFNTCLSRGESGIVKLFRHERDYEKLVGYWTAWRNVTGAKIRNLFVDAVKLRKIEAQENGYDDIASWQLFYDFEENGMKKTIVELYEQILPLYKELHAYVRYCLSLYYPGKLTKDGPIPAHILGNVWGQKWNNILSIIQKCRSNTRPINLQKKATESLSHYSVLKMFKTAEAFYDSINMYKMTPKFWERSVLTKIPNRITNCHASAHDFSNGFDFRIKMCTEKNINDFTTIHHEMGHIQYYMAYRHLPIYYRGSANSGFHEAIGDTIALSVKTPEHLHKIGLINQLSESDDFDLDYLMITALEKVVFLPFALTMDAYVWGIYNNSVPYSRLNEHWWNLVYQFQGLIPPTQRSETDFDAGAKYHLAFGKSYIRYFVSSIIQFQFYESMCHISGFKGPLHRCDFYQSKKAGSQLLEMLKQGRTKHWRTTMKILTSEDSIKTDALLKFFEPLYQWLKNINSKLNNHVGW